MNGSRLERLLDSHPYVMADGGMGTMLMAAGLEFGDPPEEWNVKHPEKVQGVHRGYADAGAQLVLTNTFGGNRQRLKLHKLENRASELNRAAAQIARAAVGPDVVVAGDIGPTGELIEPLGTLTVDAAKETFAEQAQALAEGGVDVIWIETMSALEEMQAAIEGARSVCDLPICATFTFDTRGHTMMGLKPAQAIQQLLAWGVLAGGGNCGNGPAEIEGVIQAMHATAPDAILIAKSNAGIPEVRGDRVVYSGTPEIMAQYAVRVRELGARIIGACCGSTPDHIRAMATALVRDA